VVDREVLSLAEAIRAYGTAHGEPTAALSRGIAGLAGNTLVVNLPGSTGGCRDGIAVLEPVLVHAVDQVRGGDHPSSAVLAAEAAQDRAGPAPGGAGDPAAPDAPAGEAPFAGPA